MFYFSYLEYGSTDENTFVISLHPYKVAIVNDCLEEEFAYNPAGNLDFELYKLVMSN